MTHCDEVPVLVCRDKGLFAAVLANTVFPAVCVYYLWTATEALPMQNIMRTLLAVILASLIAKLALEGTHTLPKYCRKRGARAVGELHATQCNGSQHCTLCYFCVSPCWLSAALSTVMTTVIIIGSQRAS